MFLVEFVLGCEVTIIGPAVISAFSFGYLAREPGCEVDPQNDTGASTSLSILLCILDVCAAHMTILIIVPCVGSFFEAVLVLVCCLVILEKSAM